MEQNWSFCLQPDKNNACFLSSTDTEAITNGENLLQQNRNEWTIFGTYKSNRPTRVKQSWVFFNCYYKQILVVGLVLHKAKQRKLLSDSTRIPLCTQLSSPPTLFCSILHFRKKVTGWKPQGHKTRLLSHLMPALAVNLQDERNARPSLLWDLPPTFESISLFSREESRAQFLRC